MNTKDKIKGLDKLKSSLYYIKGGKGEYVSYAVNCTYHN